MFILRLVLILGFSCSLFAEISGAEGNTSMSACAPKCPEVVTTNYGVITEMIFSLYDHKKETYPGSGVWKCIPCACGDGTVDTEFGEQCDDRNNVGFDGCTADCKKEICGDGVQQPKNYDGKVEQCDKGASLNSNLPNTCRPTCDAPRCGDNILDDLTLVSGTTHYEECDYGNQNSDNSTDGCDSKCRVIKCGDGDVRGAEACDDGNDDDSDSCTSNCMAAKCGDGIVNETCITPKCPTDGPKCIIPAVCEKEKCDGSDFTGLVKPDPNMPDEVFNAKTCNASCNPVYPPYCSDGVKNGAEQCDDKNLVDGDGCSKTCQVEDPCKDIKLPRAYDINGLRHVSANVCFKGRFKLGGVRANWNGINVYSIIYESDNSVETTFKDGANYTTMFVNKAAGYLGQGGRDGVGIWGGQIRYYYSKTIPTLVCYTCATVRVFGCFAPETSIRLADGSDIAIRDLKAGDYVLNPATKSSVKVKSIIESYEDKPLVIINYGGKSLKVTDGHPVLTPFGIKKAIDLKVGELLFSKDGNLVVIESISQTERKSTQKVVNLILDSEDDSYSNHMVLSDGIQTGDYIAQNVLAEE